MNAKSTLDEVVELAHQHGADVTTYTLGKWVSHGRADLKANRRQTAYARFAQKYDQLKREHCAADANRTREFDLALQILERACDCGNEKMTMPDGTLEDTCRQCQDLEEQRQRRP